MHKALGEPPPKVILGRECRAVGWRKTLLCISDENEMRHRHSDADRQDRLVRGIRSLSAAATQRSR